MTKTKALMLGIVCIATMIAFVTVKNITGVFAFASGAVLFLSIWFYKYQRDRRIIANARKKRAVAQVPQSTPAMTNSGSRFLKGSQSHDRRGNLNDHYIKD